jgi:hypothetical protein
MNMLSWLLLFSTFVVASIISRSFEIPTEPSDSAVYFISWHIGAATATFIVSFLITGSFRSKNRKLTWQRAIATFAVGIAFLVLSRIGATPTTVEERSGKTIFAPVGSDFTVTFSGPPAIQEFEFVTMDGLPFRGLRAELRAGDSFQRAEVVLLPAGYSREESRDTAFAKLKEYAAHNGLSALELKWEATPIAWRASLRGSKLVESWGRRIGVTFETSCYFGERSLFMVYVGAPSEFYPSERLVDFLNSVRLATKSH